MTTRVVVADDEPLLRSGLAVVLGTAPDLELVGEAGDGTAAVSLCARLCPDVVLLDVRMPGIDGVEATQRITSAAADGARATRVLVLTTFPDDDVVAGALRAGASGFLLKRASPERLLDAVRAVAAGEVLLDPAVTRAVVQRSLRAGGPTGAREAAEVAAARRAVGTLTPRELQVVALVCGGRSNAEVAAALVVAESTVQSHVKHVLAKLGARDRAQAVVIAHRSGLVDLS